MHGWDWFVTCLYSKVGAVYVASVVLYKNDGMDWSLFCIVLIRTLITSDSNDRQRYIKDVLTLLCGGRRG